MKIYLDLLPQEKKDQLRRNKIFRRIMHEEILFLIPLVVFIIILFNIYYVLGFQYRSMLAMTTADSSQNQYQELAKYEDKFKQTNEDVEILDKIQNSNLIWTNFLTELSLIMPEGIFLSDLSSKNYQVFLAGKARSRENLLNFKANLEQSTCFSNINIPLSNLVVKQDVDFQMDIEVKKECLNRNR